VLLALAAVAWLVLGYVLGMPPWLWLGPPALTLLLATELSIEKREMEERMYLNRLEAYLRRLR